MKSKKKIELDVDIIGNQEPLTEKAKQTISDFIRKKKCMQQKEKLFYSGNSILGLEFND